MVAPASTSLGWGNYIGSNDLVAPLRVCEHPSLGKVDKILIHHIYQAVTS